MEITQETMELARSLVLPLSKPMSESAKRKLRTANDAIKADQLATERFAALFRRLPKEIPVLVELYKRIYAHDRERITDDTLLRMSQKLVWSLRHGWQVGSVCDVILMGALTADEGEMPEEAFAKHLARTQCAEPVSLAVGSGVTTYSSSVEAWSESAQAQFWNSDLPEPSKKTRAPFWNPKRCRKEGRCKAGSLCLNATGKTPAPAADGRQFCNDTCQECYAIRKRKQNAAGRDLGNGLASRALPENPQKAQQNHYSLRG